MSQSGNILVYRLGSLGDTVIALPCFRLIRKIYPHSKITILTNQPISGKAAPAMAILENSGLCDEAISYPVGLRNLSELKKIRQIIRQIQPDVLINLAAGRGLVKSIRDYLFFRSCGIKKMIGTPLRRRDLKVEQINDGEFESESQRLASRLAPLGAIDLAENKNWELGLTPTERKQALDLLPTGPKRFVAVSVGTKLVMKDWGENNWEKLLVLLSKELPNTTLILIGASDEWERSEKMGRLWAGGYVNFCGKLSPRISAAVLEHCAIFIGHDSGPMHLASVVGTPTLGIFSWICAPGQWFPGHKSWKSVKAIYPALPKGGWNAELVAKQNDSQGIRQLKPAHVFRSVMELLEYNSSLTGIRAESLPVKDATR